MVIRPFSIPDEQIDAVSPVPRPTRDLDRPGPHGLDRPRGPGRGGLDGEHDAGDPLLGVFLADRDATCPACGYNLRGVVSAACPECGLELRLGVREAGGFGRRWALLLLIFCWLLAASAMNDVRAIRAIYETATSRQYLAQLTPTFTFSRDFASPRIAGLTVPRTIVIEPPDPPVAPAPGVMQPAEAADDDPTSPTFSEGQPPDEAETTATIVEPGTIDVDIDLNALRAPAPPTPFTLRPGSRTPVRLVLPPQRNARMSLGGPSWAAVTWAQWLRAGWWTVLGLAASVGLLVLFWYRRRPTSTRVARLVTATAWCGFVGYFAYHVVHFVHEIM